MKKKILIIIGAVLIILILGIWAYLFTYGAPKDASDIFAQFGIGNDTPSVASDGFSNEAYGSLDANPIEPRKLRQLTLRPVAGATFTGTGILYAEQGTGHIYHLNFTSDTETLVSGTTIPKTRTAVFSPGGGSVALTTTYNTAPETIVGSVTLESGSGALDGVSLPLGARNVDFGGSTSTLMYTLTDGEGTSGYSYDIQTGSGEQIFRIPLRDIRVLWNDSPYVYTTPTVTQKGSIYRIEKNDLVYVTEADFGLMGILYDGNIIISKSGDNGVTSYVVHSNGTQTGLPLPLIPEKCTGTTSLLCASSNLSSEREFPDAWYKGSISFSDSLWSIDIADGKGTLLSDFLAESGREIDVRDIGTNEDGSYIYFINKNDNTLWMFDTTL